MLCCICTLNVPDFSSGAVEAVALNFATGVSVGIATEDDELDDDELNNDELDDDELDDVGQL